MTDNKPKEQPYHNHHLLLTGSFAGIFGLAIYLAIAWIYSILNL